MTPSLDVRVGDMRKTPFADASFDAAVSAFAVDPLRREGVERTLAEMARVHPGDAIAAKYFFGGFVDLEPARSTIELEERRHAWWVERRRPAG